MCVQSVITEVIGKEMNLDGPYAAKHSSAHLGNQQKNFESHPELVVILHRLRLPRL